MAGSDYFYSTSITTDSSGAKVSELRYKPFGEVRYAWTSAPVTTPSYSLSRFTYTGQYTHMDDPTTAGVTEGFGLMFYNARWYDPALGRFAQADTIVPAGVQGLDRYAYVNNSPMNFVDPSGHEPKNGEGACYELGCKNANGTTPSQGNGKGGRSGDGDDDMPECPYHHCEVDTNLYEMGWENFGQAWDIWTNPNASYGQKWLAGTYMSYWGGAHLAGAVGAGGLACSGFASCLTAANSVLGIGNTACGGDMCSSEMEQSGIVTVIGRYPENVETAKRIGGNYLNIQMDVWRSMNEVEQWTRNKEWLQEAVIRGDMFYLASNVNRAVAGTGYAKELEYLYNIGYTVALNGKYLLPPGR